MKTRYHYLTAVVIWVAALIGAYEYTPDLTHIVVIAGVVLMAILYLMEDHRIDLARIAAENAPPDLVDIWALQKELMQASKQATPALPMLTGHSLTYLALIAEELSETMIASAKVLKATTEPSSAQSDMWVTLMTQAEDLKEGSLNMRTLLGKPATKEMFSESLNVIPDDELARELLDGGTDMAVTVAGFIVASGLPGPDGYAEVVGSNLSKADPRTGIIAIDASGKWIKGEAYAPPDLVRVLRKQLADFAEATESL